MDLGPGVEMQWAGGPRLACSQEPADNETGGVRQNISQTYAPKPLNSLKQNNKPNT